MKQLIGATATVLWNNGEVSKNYYFSFEDFPAGTDPDTYILPLAQIPDEQVFMYCTEGEFLQMTKEAEGEFKVGDYELNYATLDTTLSA